ncbi:MAG: NADH-quinone oxidoreductase subunit NuoK [Solirubrobacteraceae bacterium]|nr:NADH-quinone oxidoreductase subunit NuoK [Solirubrobacteraceae bacterium]
MSVTWYLALSAILFALGLFGVFVRRNPLVLLLCLEMLLGSANLALLAFDRYHGQNDGSILAIIVMVVAACEVTVGLGIVVAMHRRGQPIDVDKTRELHG